MTRLPLILIRVRVLPHSLHTARLSRHYLPLPQVSTMDRKPQRPKDRAGAISALKAAIEAVDLAEKTSSIPSAESAFGSVSILLAVVRVCFLPFCDDLLQVHI